jgi:hypothetical protein
MTVKLLDKETKSLVDFEPNAVNAAVDSGKFLFPKNRGVPVRADGQLKYISAADAAKYRDRLLFVNDEDVERGQAEERFGGLGGAAQALAYGGVKGLTLGTVPALASALSPEFAEYSKQIELGRPGVTAAGEIASLAVDPFALAGKALRLGSKGARVAQEAGAAARAAESAAAPRVMEEVYEAERATPMLGAGPTAEAAPLRLGGRVAGAEPQAGVGFAAREAQPPRALPPAGREPVAAPESPLTYQAPPFESRVTTDLRLGRSDTAERIGELDRTIQSTLGSKAKGAKKDVKGLREERDALAQQLDEYDFQLAKYEGPEAEALGAQAERAAEATKYRVPPAKPTAVEGVAGMTQEQLADYYAANGLPEGVDAYAALTARPSMRGLSRAEMVERFNASGGAEAGRKWADQMESTWLKIAEEKPAGIKAAGGDSMWTNFRVGKDVSPAAGAARDKAYVTLGDPLSLSGEDVTGFLEALRKAKYNGQVKVPGSGARLITNFDNIVMHGATKADAELGEELARKFFGERVEATSFGRDVAGKSHTQLLAESLEKNAPNMVVGKVGAAAPELKLGERAAAEAEQARERLRMGGGAPEYVGPEPGPLALAGERPLAPTAAREGVLEAEFADLPDAGPRLTPEPAAPIAAAPVPQGGGLTLPPGLASMSAQGGLYGASEEARRQATGESQGGMGAILGAGALGAAIPAGLMLGGKVAAKGAQALATGAREAGLIERIAAGASTIEKQHIARSFDLSRDQVTRLNNKFAIPEIEQQGTDAFVKFIKGELDDVSKLKAAFPDDAFLQSIPENTSLKFGQLTPDRKKAFADAVERFYGKEYDTIFTDAVRSAPVDRSIIDRIIADTEARAVAGAPQRGLESVAPEVAAMRDYQGQHSVGTLRELQSRIGEIFRGRQGEGGKFTEAQAAMYGGLKRALADAVEAAEPGAAARLAENDVRYEMSKIMAEGANKVLSKATTTSPIGRDLLSQFALGFAAVGHPLAATKFFVTTVGLRHLYNTRGEGIIADMAGKLSTSLRKNPTAAATEAADIIVNARRPMLLGMSATKLTDAKPEDYTSMSRAVRELEATRDKAKRQIADATSGLTPEEQQKSVEFFDNQLNALASALPKGIPTGKALNEQEKNYTIFARAILDPQVYGVQAILNGGLGASVAADAINSLGPQGQEFLQKLGDNLQARISESEQLRGREDMLQTLRNVKTATRKSVGGGGGARLRALHPSSDVKNIAKGAPSAFQNAAKAFSGSAKGIQ